jgi:YidC/Oxa1 family membrane protein insertase
LNIWDIVILQWMINVLIALSHFLFNNFGLTIIVFTIIIRLVLLPLTLRQLRATKKMQDLQPKLAELQKKYAKDRQKLAQEQMALYKESGVSATGCAIPMLIQFPIWIGLYQAIMLALAINPDALLNLSRYLYSWAIPMANLPLNNYFMGMNLANGNYVLAIIVGISMWVQQKMVTPSNQDPKLAQQSQMMLWMMPIIFTFFSLSFPSGLALYWVISNIFSIVVQYFVTGWGGLNFSGMFRRSPQGPGGGSSRDKKLKKRLEMESAPSSSKTLKPGADSNLKEGTSDGKSGDISQNGGGSDQKGSGPTKRWFG